MRRGKHDSSMIATDTPPAWDDAAVIQRSLTQPERFATVFDRHAPHIHRYLARRVGWQFVDDLVAETFLTAFRKRSRYDTNHRDARPWLYGIATNLVGQHRREEVRRYRVPELVGHDPVGGDHAERVVANVTSRSVRSVLSEALAALTPGDRDVVLLIACEELTYEEVARALDIPVGTVRSRLHRARFQLRETLGETEAAATCEEILSNG